jgi:hypothetical protein
MPRKEKNKELMFYLMKNDLESVFLECELLFDGPIPTYKTAKQTRFFGIFLLFLLIRLRRQYFYELCIMWYIYNFYYNSLGDRYAYVHQD